MLQLMLAGALTARVASEAGSSARVAQSAAENAIAPIDARLDQLELACMGMWQLLKTKFDLTDAELVQVIEEIDASDGVKDGKLKGVQAVCPSCQRKLVTRSRVRCVWCGHDLPKTAF